VGPIHPFIHPSKVLKSKKKKVANQGKTYMAPFFWEGKSIGLDPKKKGSWKEGSPFGIGNKSLGSLFTYCHDHSQKKFEEILFW